MNKPTAGKRTRDGCWTCRQRKKKCDARHPSCQNCEARGIQCEGYATKLLWPETDARIGMSRRGPARGTNSVSSPRVDSPSTKKRRSSSSASMIANDLAASSASLFTSLPSSFSAPDRIDYCVLDRHSDEQQAYPDHESSEDIQQTWTLTQSLSPHPIKLTPTQTILFEHYVTDFSTIYPTCIDSSNPFLSVFANLAMRNETTLCALLALSGTRIAREGSFEMKQEIIRLKGYALKGCQRLLMGNLIRGTSFLENVNSSNHVKRPEDDLLLVATVMLLILHDNLSGETHENLRPHLEFLNRFFTAKKRRDSCSSITSSGFVSGTPISDFSEAESDISETWSSEYRFLHSEFLYNDLLVAMASGRPTLSKYRATEEDMSSSSERKQRSSRFYFPDLISRIVNFDGEVTIEAFDEWDGRLDWMPSFCYREPGNVDGNLDAKNSTGSRSTSSLDRRNSYVMSDIYRDAGQVYLLQRMRLSWHLEHSTTYLEVQNEAKIQVLVSNIVKNLSSLPLSSKYENAIRWPVGIIAPEISEQADRDIILSRIRKLEARFGMEVFRKFRTGLEEAWGPDSDLIEAATGNDLVSNSFVGNSALLLG